MRINILIDRVKFSTLYKFILLKIDLQKYNIETIINIVSPGSECLEELLNYHESNVIYSEYIEQIRNYIKLGKKFFLNIDNKEDYYLIPMDGCSQKTEVYEKYHQLMSRGLNKNIILYKFRLCNDFIYHYIKKKTYLVWLPSRLYLNNSTLLTKFIDKTDFVRPLEIPDEKNCFIIFHQQRSYVYEKYKIDENKPIVLFNHSNINPELYHKHRDAYDCTEIDIFNRLLTDRELHENFNILISFPYGFFPPNKTFINKSPVKILQSIDYSFFVTNRLVSAMIGGISTSLLDSLIVEIPVLNIAPHFYKRTENEKLLMCRYKSNVRKKDLFEGENVSIDGDWIFKINEIINKKYDYERKRNIWISNNTLKDQILFHLKIKRLKIKRFISI